jgi:hypothetical protein
MHVHVLGEKLERLTDGGLSSPNHSVVLDMCVDAYLRCWFQSGCSNCVNRGLLHVKAPGALLPSYWSVGVLLHHGEGPFLWGGKTVPA